MESWVLRGIMFLCELLVPLAIIGLGQKFTKDPPRTIDPMCGYRTVMSMKNQDTWEFAQRYYGRTCWGIGWALLALTAMVQPLMLRCPVESIEFCFWQIGFVTLEMAAAAIAMYIPVERALKRNFDESGMRR